VDAIRKAARRSGTHEPEIKVNTVVSELNVDEGFETVLIAVRPDRWKILKMLPVYSSETTIDDAAFRRFARRHRKFVRKRPEFRPRRHPELRACTRSDFLGITITTEDNDEMTGSYAMVDPLARFFWYDESQGDGYQYSDPMTAVSVDVAWKPVQWDEQKYTSRYTELMDCEAGSPTVFMGLPAFPQRRVVPESSPLATIPALELV
jgi:radical S-adenosyl methionine domain-containing protein 2